MSIVAVNRTENTQKNDPSGGLEDHFVNFECIGSTITMRQGRLQECPCRYEINEGENDKYQFLGLFGLVQLIKIFH